MAAAFARQIVRAVIQGSPRLMDWFSAIHRVRTVYRQRHGRSLSLLFPRRFSEKIQWRKLFDLNPAFATLSDKLAVRDFVRDRVGADMLIPLLWVGDDPESIPVDRLLPPYVIKSNHAAGHTIVVTDGTGVDREAIGVTMRSWLAHCHGSAMDEPGYVHVPRRLMVERLLLRTDGTSPREHKVFVFDGQARFIETVTVGPDGERMTSYHDARWVRQPWIILRATHPDALGRPPRLDRLIAAAERLARGFDHLRVDLYDCDDTIYVGELTLYSFSGLVAFAPDEADFVLGRCWRIPRPRLRAVATVLFRTRRIVPVAPRVSPS